MLEKILKYDNDIIEQIIDIFYEEPICASDSIIHNLSRYDDNLTVTQYLSMKTESDTYTVKHIKLPLAVVKNENLKYRIAGVEYSESEKLFLANIPLIHYYASDLDKLVPEVIKAQDKQELFSYLHKNICDISTKLDKQMAYKFAQIFNREFKYLLEENTCRYVAYEYRVDTPIIDINHIPITYEDIISAIILESYVFDEVEFESKQRSKEMIIKIFALIILIGLELKTSNETVNTASDQSLDQSSDRSPGRSLEWARNQLSSETAVLASNSVSLGWGKKGWNRPNIQNQ